MKRTQRSASKTVLIVVTAFILLAASAASSISARELTFEERVKAQQAIERVYWKHRIWPEQNHQPKPTLGEVLPASAIEGKGGSICGFRTPHARRGVPSHINSSSTRWTEWSGTRGTPACCESCSRHWGTIPS